jgi:hypothetical protein
VNSLLRRSVQRCPWARILRRLGYGRVSAFSSVCEHTPSSGWVLGCVWWSQGRLRFLDGVVAGLMDNLIVKKWED